ncbi:MAG: hypothetical protein L0322_23615, partial [Chloroflexi bacterium]|nr:hypothetical protein [Chloroflexota bacterium]
MGTQYQCQSDDRRNAVRTTLKDGKPVLNGIDFLEVSEDQTTLTVHFIHNLPGSGSEAVPPAPAPGLARDNLR